MISLEDAVALAGDVAKRLIAVEGVAAVALGGSRARGTATAESDVDLGIYYHASNPPSVAELRSLATELDDDHRPELATEFGEWGRWVNGGAWLRIDGHPVDWLYREIGQVTDTIEACRRGQITCDYYLGHPHGFHNYVYLGEIASCIPLKDPGNALGAMKVLVGVYPPAMRTAVVSRYLYDARFMLAAAEKSAPRGDVFHVSGCLFRVVAALVQVLFALNEHYFTNEKGSVTEVESMALRPPRWSRSVAVLLGGPGTSPDRLAAALARAEALIVEVEDLCTREGLGMSGRLP